MKLLLLLSSLVAPVLATLLIPKEEYIRHNLFKNSEDGKQCDDCCDVGVRLGRGRGVTSFLLVVCRQSFPQPVLPLSMTHLTPSFLLYYTGRIEISGPIFWQKTQPVLALLERPDFLQRGGTRHW